MVLLCCQLVDRYLCSTWWGSSEKPAYLESDLVRLMNHFTRKSLFEACDSNLHVLCVSGNRPENFR